MYFCLQIVALLAENFMLPFIEVKFFNALYQAQVFIYFATVLNWRCLFFLNKFKYPEI